MLKAFRQAFQKRTLESGSCPATPLKSVVRSPTGIREILQNPRLRVRSVGEASLSKNEEISYLKEELTGHQNEETFIPLNIREIYRMKSSWNVVRDKMREAGIELFRLYGVKLYLPYSACILMGAP